MTDKIAEYVGVSRCPVIVDSEHGGVIRVWRIDPVGCFSAPQFTLEQYAGFIRQEFERLKANGEIEYNE